MMKSRRFLGRHVLAAVLAGIAVSVVAALVVLPAVAQKAKKAQPVQTAQAVSSTLRDVLTQYQDRVTNLGTLKKVTGDYFVVEEEGVTAMHPFAAIQALRLVREEDSVSTRLEIRLVARE